MALFSFRQAELFFLGGAAAPPAPLGRSPVNRMGGEYIGFTMKYLFEQETAHLMLDVATHR